MSSAQLPEWVTALRANNPSHMTLTGTNSYLIGGRHRHRVLVDPGPAGDPEHLRDIVEELDGRPSGIVLTHRHDDHTGALPELDRLCPQAPSYALDVRYATELLSLDQWADRLSKDGLTWQIRHTPGHTEDSVSALVTDTQNRSVLLAGDTILGAGSSVIAHPDGDVSAYLDSLIDLITWLADSAPEAALLPGHGPLGASAKTTAEQYLQHRTARINQVRTALENGARTVADVTDQVYPEVTGVLRSAAEASIRAHVKYIRGH